MVKMFELHILNGKLYGMTTAYRQSFILSVWEFCLHYVCTTHVPAAHRSQKALGLHELELQGLVSC